MAQQLKRWESPRKSGRNDKGRGGTARQRQLQKRQQTLRKRLIERPEQDRQIPPGEQIAPFFYGPLFMAHRLTCRIVDIQLMGADVDKGEEHDLEG